MIGSVRLKESLLSNRPGDKALNYERNSFYNQARIVNFKKESEINSSNSIVLPKKKNPSWGIFMFCAPCSTDSANN